MLHPGCCALLVSVVWHCRLCKYGNPEFSFVVPRWWNELPSTTRAGASLSTFTQLLKTHLFRERLPFYLALRLVLNLHLQQLHSCTSFFYFLCKIVFIVTLGLYCL